MLEALLAIIAIGVIGSLTVPLTMLALARFGYFEPIEFSLFGRHWQFAPRIGVATTTYTRATTWVLPRAASTSCSELTVARLGTVRTVRALAQAANVATKTDAIAYLYHDQRSARGDDVVVTRG